MRDAMTSKRARGIARLAEIQNEQTMCRVKAKQRASPFPSAAEAKAGGSSNRHVEFDPSESSAFGLEFAQTKRVIRPPQLAHEVDGESSGSDGEHWGRKKSATLARQPSAPRWMISMDAISAPTYCPSRNRRIGAATILQAAMAPAAFQSTPHLRFRRRKVLITVC